MNGGTPLPWAKKLISTFASKKFAGPALPGTKEIACLPAPGHPEMYPGRIDFHRAWKIRDPINPHGPWYRLLAGKSGVLLTVGGGVDFGVSRCVLEQRRFSMGFTTIGWPGDRLVTFYGIVADDVTEVRATGGIGTRVGPDGALLPVDVSMKPKHNVYHLIAPNGAAQLTFVRRNAPATVSNIVGGVSTSADCPPPSY